MKLTQKQKVLIFDWLLEQLNEDGLEILFKTDNTGEHDFVSCSDEESFYQYLSLFVNNEV